MQMYNFLWELELFQMALEDVGHRPVGEETLSPHSEGSRKLATGH